MSSEHHDEGAVVPVNLRSTADDALRDDVRFAVEVEVYGGYGNSKHIYPLDPVESTAELFTVGNIDGESVVTDDVRLYTIPHDELR